MHGEALVEMVKIVYRTEKNKTKKYQKPNQTKLFECVSSFMDALRKRRRPSWQAYVLLTQN